MNKIIKILFCLGMLLQMISPIYAEETLTIYSDYYYMVDMDNGQVILDHGSEEMIYPASMTKMMTLIVALENIQDTTQRVTLDTDIFEGLYEANASLAGFNLNETVTIEDCLYGLFLPSGAEVTRALAFYVAGSEEAYVEMMNQKAAELEMINTHFVNTTGLHDNDHKTTLRDLAILMEYCLQNDQFKTIFSTRSYTAKSGSMHSSGITWQSNMFRNIDRIGWDELDDASIVGGKTGYTIPAGLCLASVAEQDGRRYMLITAHAPSGSTPYHAIDAVNIYNEVLNHYQKSILIHQEEELGTSKLRFNLTHPTIAFHAKEKVELTLPDTIDLSQIETHLSVLESYDAPIQRGDILGTATLIYQGETLYSFELIAQEDIGRNPLLYGGYVLGQWMIDHLIWTGLILFALGFMLWRIFLYRREIKDTLHRKTKRKRRKYRL